MEDIFKYFLSFLVMCGCVYGNCYAGTTAYVEQEDVASNDVGVAVELTSEEVDSEIPFEVRQGFGVSYELVKAYRYMDCEGIHFLLLTERAVYDSQTIDRKADRIQAFNIVRVDEESYQLKWVLNDFINEFEESIRFWTRYISLEDLDGDGCVEPILVYGSTASYGSKFENGRVKIIVRYNNEKIALRHQNASLDDDRVSQLDDTYYSLPDAVKNQIVDTVFELREQSLANFDSRFIDMLNEVCLPGRENNVKAGIIFDVLDRLPLSMGTWEWPYENRVVFRESVERGVNVIARDDGLFRKEYIDTDYIFVNVVDGVWYMKVVELGGGRYLVLTDDIVTGGHSIRAYEYTEVDKNLNEIEFSSLFSMELIDYFLKEVNSCREELIINNFVYFLDYDFHGRSLTMSDHYDYGENCLEFHEVTFRIDKDSMKYEFVSGE